MLSKKYGGLHPELVSRVSSEEAAKYQSDREREKAVKRRLHTIHGAFVGDGIYKKAGELIDGCDGANYTERAKALLNLHASTRERFMFIPDIYSFIFDAAGTHRSVIDLGCGFNPFALPLIQNSGIKIYDASDIDGYSVGLINLFFTRLTKYNLIGTEVLARCVDLVTYIPEGSYDLALMLKLCPTLDTQRENRSAEVIEGISARRIAVSFPTRTLCGRNCGFLANYSAKFENYVGAQNGKIKITAKTEIGGELVYVIEKYDSLPNG